MIAFLMMCFLLGHITIFCVSIYLHRSLAHRAVTLHPSIAYFCRLWLWFTTGIITRQWVSIHRKHHRFTDEIDDPHSPVQKGFWSILFGGVFFYLKEGSNPATMRQYGRGCPNDRLERLMLRFPYAGVIYTAVLMAAFFGWFGLGLFIVNFAWTPFWAAGVVNGVGHAVGYRNNNTPDQSKNFLPVGVLLLGEELHNNHHSDPGSAKFSQKWWEIDIGWGWIKLLVALKLASLRESI